MPCFGPFGDWPVLLKTNILDLAAKKYIAGFEILAIWEFLQMSVDFLCFVAEFYLFNNVYIFFHM